MKDKTRLKDIFLQKKVKKVWSKPQLLSGKGIGFLGLGNVQTGDPYTDFS